jgi:hypothetical protein
MKYDSNDNNTLADSTTAPGALSRREFLAVGTTVVAGLAVGISGADAATEPKTNVASATGSTTGSRRPKTMLVKSAAVLVTMDPVRREIPDGGLYIEDGIITQVGPTSSLPKTAEEVLDLKGHVLLPGLVTTHHHLYQHLTRVGR